MSLVVALALAAPVAVAQEPPPGATELIEGPPTHVVSGTGAVGLALRVGPGLDQHMLAVLPEGTGVRILSGPISDGAIDWYHVQLQGAGTLSGYGNGAYLAPFEPPVFLETATVVAAASPPPAPAAPLPLATLPTVASAPPGSRVFDAKVTAYALGADGGAVGSTTASGTRTRWGTVAADIRLFPFGTKLLIEGFEGTVFVVEDTGSAVRGLVFDIWFPDLASAVRFGTQRRKVTVLPSGA